MEFIASQPHTIGIELELQLLDPDTLDLVDGIIPLMEFYPDTSYVKPEFIQNTVEVLTRVCTNCDELAAHLGSITRDVSARCSELGITLCGSGSHPFSQRLALITPQPRYQRLAKLSGYIGYTQITFATHVHIGMESGQQAIETMDRLKPYLPLLVALSANSPFWRGYETGFASYRHRILAAIRSYGIPPTFGSWNRFVQFAATTQKADIFRSINDIHWDIRPRPHLGTIEVRVMDAQSTVSGAIALAAFVRALAAFVREHPLEAENSRLPQPLHWWLEKENHFQASRRGMKASFVYNEKGDHNRITDVWEQTVEAVSPIADKMGDGPWLEYLKQYIGDGPGYNQQLDFCEVNDSLPGLVSMLTDTLKQDLQQMPGQAAAK